MYIHTLYNSIGTLMMVKNVSLKHNYEARILKVSWDAPHFFPYSYKLLLNYDLLYNDTYTQYRKTQYSLESTTVTANIYGILENSKCKVNLRAEYNPASIDSGLDKTFVTILPVKSKCIVYALHFITHKLCGDLDIVTFSVVGEFD